MRAPNTAYGNNRVPREASAGGKKKFFNQDDNLFILRTSRIYVYKSLLGITSHDPLDNQRIYGSILIQKNEVRCAAPLTGLKVIPNDSVHQLAGVPAA